MKSKWFDEVFLPSVTERMDSLPSGIRGERKRMNEIKCTIWKLGNRLYRITVNDIRYRKLGTACISDIDILFESMEEIKDTLEKEQRESVKIISKEAVVEEKTKSCGRLQHKSPPNFIDLTGRRFGRLVVLERAENYISPSGNRLSQWLCQCDCGNTTVIVTSSLTRGITSSCGCKAVETTKELCTIHGMTN